MIIIILFCVGTHLQNRLTPVTPLLSIEVLDYMQKGAWLVGN